MSRRIAAGLAAGLLFAAGCRRDSKGADAARRAHPPKGDAVWFTDPEGAAEAGISERLRGLSAVAVFLPAGALGVEGGRPVFTPVALPAIAAADPAIVLVVRAEPVVAVALSTEGGLDPEGTAKALADGLAPLLKKDGAGRVAGIHLDFPFTSASAKRSGLLLSALRSRAPGVYLSIAAPPAPDNDDARKSLTPLTSEADAMVARVFGLDARADALAVDHLGPPWWAAFGTAAQGALVPAGSATATAGAPERWLDPLTGNPRVDFENDLSVPDASFSAFHLTARGPVRIEETILDSGDRVSYRVPVLSELLFQLGSTLAGKKHALGRLLVFDGRSESGRIFPVAAFEDVKLGRSLSPALVVTVSPAGRNAVSVEAANRSSHASIASRSSNWVEIDVSPARAGEVTLGGFDRYATYDDRGNPVTPGRATRVRFFETLVAPGETISPARIVLRGKPPSPCCRYRSELIAASGSKDASEWTEPPVPVRPTPTPAPRKKKR